MNLRPLGDRLVVEHVEQSDRTSGGVFLPDTAKEKPQEGKVLAVGSGRTLDSGTKKKTCSPFSPTRKSPQEFKARRHGSKRTRI